MNVTPSPISPTNPPSNNTQPSKQRPTFDPTTFAPITASDQEESSMVNGIIIICIGSLCVASCCCGYIYVRNKKLLYGLRKETGASEQQKQAIEVDRIQNKINESEDVETFNLEEQIKNNAQSIDTPTVNEDLPSKSPKLYERVLTTEM